MVAVSVACSVFAALAVLFPHVGTKVARLTARAGGPAVGMGFTRKAGFGEHPWSLKSVRATYEWRAEMFHAMELLYRATEWALYGEGEGLTQPIEPWVGVLRRVPCAGGVPAPGPLWVAAQREGKGGPGQLHPHNSVPPAQIHHIHLYTMTRFKGDRQYWGNLLW